MATKNPLVSILESNKLTGPNYSDWLRNLKIILDSEKRTYVLFEGEPSPEGEAPTRAERDAIQKWKDDNLQARCLMLANMSPDLLGRFTTT